MTEKKKTIKYKIRNSDTEEVCDRDLIEVNKDESTTAFKNKYKDFYDDVKNTNKTEDW